MTSVFSTVTIPAGVTILPVDTRRVQKVLLLPTVSTNLGRLLMIKDYYGTSSNSTITISTTGTDLINDFNNVYTFSNAFGSLGLTSDGVRSWRITSFYDGLSTPALPASFAPTQITGLSVWLDASDPTTITTSGTTVTQWRDKTANAYHVAPLAGLSNAVVQAAYQNNLNVMNFSGNNIYRGPNGSGRYPSDCYIVIALKSLGARSDCIAIGDTGGDNFNSLTFGEHTALRWHNGSSFFSRTPNCVSPTNETSTGFLLMNWSLADNNFLIRRNGTQLVQTNTYTYTLSGTNAYQFGFRHTNLNSPDIAFNAYVAEVLIYNSQLATTPRQQIEGYLAWKWGLQASLPAGHPYLSAPP